MEEEDISKISLEDQCVHKSWKVRITGYESAAKLFKTLEDDKSPEWSKYLGLVKKFVVDSNAPAQEKGLDAVLAYVDNCSIAGKTVHDVMSGLVQKCIAAPKARTKELGSQICLMYVEIEKHEIVIDELLKGTESKNPKIVAASVHIIADALREFGIKVVAPKKIIPRALILLEDRDKTVRDETKKLLVDLFRYVGPALKTPLQAVKATQQVSELLAEFDKEEKNPLKPTRFLRSEQAKRTKAAAAEAEEDEDEGAGTETGGEEIDPLELVQPKPILNQLSKNFWTGIEAAKWAERKEALEGLEKILNETPKIETADYGDLVSALIKIVAKDSNVVVATTAIRCITGLAKGVRKKYHPYAVATMKVLFDKFKEKKQNVVSALREATDAVYISTTLESLLENVIEQLENKNPSIKAEIAGFLARCFTKCTPAILHKKLLKSLASALLKALVDQDPVVRDNAAMALGTARKVVGEKAIQPYLGDVDNQKMAKIMEYHDKAVIQVKQPPKKAKEPAKPERPATGGAKIVKPQGSGSKPVVKKTSNTRCLPAEEAFEKATAIIPAEIMDSLTGTNQAAWTQFLKLVEKLEVTPELGEILITVCCSVNSANVTSDVLAVKLTVLKLITTKMSLSRATVDRWIPDVIAAHANKDCAEAASEVLAGFVALTSVDDFARKSLTSDEIKNDPTLWAEALNWISGYILKTPKAETDREFLEMCGKEALSSDHSQVKNAGLALIGITHISGRGPKTASSKGDKSVLRSSSASKVDETLKAEMLLEDTIAEKEPTLSKASSEPRIDIGNQITEQILKELADKNWKVRAEVVTKLQGVVSSSHNITGNLGDAPPLIAARLTDSNTKIAASAIALVESLAKAMGPTGKQHVKVFLPPLLKSIGDPKAWIKTPAMSCLNTIGETSGYKEFFENEMISDALKAGSPSTRAELWSWLAEKLPNIPRTIPKDELTACLPVLYNNLEDRNAEVRKAANDAVLGFMIHLGHSAMNSACENIVKGSNVVTIKAILDKTRGLLPEKPVKSKSTTSADKNSKSAVAKMPAGSSATITKSKAKPGSAPPSRAGRKKEEDVDMSPLLKINQSKHQRVIDEQKLKTIKWNFTTPRAEFVDLLRDQMVAANVNKTLVLNMFHADFRNHIKAIESLNEELPNNVQGLMSNLDLILRWMTLRFFDTNPSVITKGLEYLSEAFSALQEENYTMYDSEASAFIPYLILKSGDAKDNVQNKVKELFEKLKNIYPVGKLFMSVMDGTKSKNSRQRAACLDVLDSYVEQYGTSICQTSFSNVVRDLMKHFNDRDAAVRTSAMKLAVTMYGHEGERFIQLMNQFTDAKDAALVEERIRKSARKKPPVASVKPMSRENIEPQEEEMGDDDDDGYGEDDDPEPPPQPLNVTPPPRQIPTNLRSSVDSQREETCANLCPGSPHPDYVDPLGLFDLTRTIRAPSPSDGPQIAFDENVIEEVESIAPVAHPAPKLTDVDLQFLNDSITQTSVKPIQMPKMTPTLSNFAQPTAIKWELAQMASSDIEKAMNSMAQIDTVLNSEKRCHLIPFVDELVAQLVHGLIILNQNNHPEVVNAYRANFAMLTKVCGSPEFCGQISEAQLIKVLQELLSLLAESKLEALDRQDMFRRVVNNIVLKLLENANKTYLICALINMLRQTMESPVGGHFNDLCVKCLWKLNRAQPKWDKELNYNRLLQEYQKFLKDYPSAWWKAQEFDVPLRTVKTMLHTMVKLRGTRVRDCLALDPTIPEDSELSLYVRKLVKHLKLEETKETNKTNSMETEKLKTENSVPPWPRLTKEHYNELSEIFKMIGDTAETSEGLKRLHNFKRSHPEADIQPFVAKGSPVFQNYIRKGLQDLEVQTMKRQLRLPSGAVNGSVKTEEDSDEILGATEKSRFNTDAERLLNRLTALQEKAGCNDSRRAEKVDIPKDSDEILKEAVCQNEDFDNLKERYARIKSQMSK